MKTCAAKRVRLEVRADVEAEPADPQQRGADHDQRHVVRRHRRRAVALALADQQAADEAGDAGVDVHDRAAREVERAFLEQEARGLPSPLSAAAASVYASGPAQNHTMCAIGRYENVNHSTMNSSTAENFMRSANAPTIRHGVIAGERHLERRRTGTRGCRRPC